MIKNLLMRVVLYSMVYINMVSLTRGQSVVLKPLSVHVLDNAFGGNALNVTCKLYRLVPSKNNVEKFSLIATAVTNADGRITEFLSVENYTFGVYRIWFNIADYFRYSHGVPTFFPEAEVTYKNTDGSAYHIPLAISPYAQSTYKGS